MKNNKYMIPKVKKIIKKKMIKKKRIKNINYTNKFFKKAIIITKIYNKIIKFSINIQMMINK